ncbi:hypothetical protein ACIBO2_43985 [Nonomuraea sp. NPDC050022]|uniref:hypothetical protein n=1 Tax=Nonomuraea sp. NPDC050022 TaxID=3364358 RepID=UPI0037A89208
MPVELVIFGCDGVLVDSERISVRVGTAALRELGWSIDEADKLPLARASVRALLSVSCLRPPFFTASMGRPHPPHVAEGLQEYAR